MNTLEADAGLQWPDYLAVAGYLAVTIWIGYRANRKQHDTEDYFLGGRSMPWFAVGLSLMATLLSTNTYLGAPGEMIKYGPAFCLGYLAFPFTLLVVMGLWIPFFMRLRMTSAYEYLDQRFDARARVVGALLFLGLRLGWISMVVYTASKAMVAMVSAPLTSLADWLGAPHPIYPVIAAVGVAATIYACVGGIRAVIWTDVLQAVMLFGGVGLIIGFVAWHDGSGVATWWHTVQSTADSPPKVVWFSTDLAERTTIVGALISAFAWNTCTHCCDQVALQRYFSTTSLSAARWSFVVNLASAIAIGVLLMMAGLALRYYYLQNGHRLPAGITATSGADDLMPLFFATELAVGFGGLILVSFLCDAMQTLGSGVNSIGAIITGDRQPQAESDAAGVRRARLTTIAAGAVVTVLAVLAARYALNSGQTIIDMLPRMFNMFLGPLAVMFIMGMFYRRATAGVVIGVALLTQLVSFIWSWWGAIPGLFRLAGLDSWAHAWISILGVDAQNVPRTPTIMLAVAVPALFGLATGAVASLLFGRAEHKGTEFTWRNVMRRPVPR